jgi:hypothetical protein
MVLHPGVDPNAIRSQYRNFCVLTQGEPAAFGDISLPDTNEQLRDF